MKYTLINCPDCRRSIDPEIMNAATLQPCPGCQAAIRALVFPARLDEGVPALPSPALPGEATCFYHESNAATASCDGCGKFICVLDDLPFGENHYCRDCINRGQKSGDLPFLVTRRIRYDRLVLAIAVLPILMWPFTLLSAPIAFFLALFFWRKPLSIVPRLRLNYVLALLVSGAQMAGWFFLFYFLFTSMTSSP